MQNVLLLLLLSSPLLVLSVNGTNDTATEASGGDGSTQAGGDGSTQAGGDGSTQAGGDGSTQASGGGENPTGGAGSTEAPTGGSTSSGGSTSGGGSTEAPTGGSTSSGGSTSGGGSTEAPTGGSSGSTSSGGSTSGGSSGGGTPAAVAEATNAPGITSCSQVTSGSCPAGQLPDVSATFTDAASCCKAADVAAKASLKAESDGQKNLLKSLKGDSITVVAPAGVALPAGAVMPTAFESPAADGSLKIKGADFGSATDDEVKAIVNNPIFVAAICTAVSPAINPSLMKIEVVAARRMEEHHGRQLAATDLKLSVKSDAEIEAITTQVCAAGQSAGITMTCSASAGLIFNAFGMCSNSTCNGAVDNVQGLCCKSNKGRCASIKQGDTFCGTGKKLGPDQMAAECAGSECLSTLPADVTKCCMTPGTPGVSSNSVVASAAAAFFLALWQ